MKPVLPSNAPAVVADVRARPVDVMARTRGLTLAPGPISRFSITDH